MGSPYFHIPSVWYVTGQPLILHRLLLIKQTLSELINYVIFSFYIQNLTHSDSGKAANQSKD
jgi:hypothetical protein